MEDELMSKIFSMAVYITSYFPLWLSVLFLDIRSLVIANADYYTEIFSICLIVVMNFISFVFIKSSLKKKTNGTHSFIVKSIKEEKNVSAEFLLTYVLPLFAFDFTTWNGMVLFAIFFLFIGYLEIEHNCVPNSIVFDFIGYSWYSCSFVDDGIGKTIETKVLIRKKCILSENEIVITQKINNEVWLIVENTQ